MELPQSRPFGTAQGSRKATHDFLSLYTHSSLQQDPKPSHGDFLKTHNFLQPQDGEQKHSPDEENSVDINVKPSPAAPPTSAVEHLLPGGIGTYSISHIPFLSQIVPKPEENVFPVATVTSNDRNDDNSNCSSYTGSGFTLWDESATQKGNSELTTKVGQWPLDRHTQTSSNHRTSVSPFSSTQALAQKNQSFMEMIKSAKEPHSMEEEDENVSIKMESSSTQRGELRVKVDGKSSDQKANTPRSKHSATEQRRRCKINDRFQMLRELVPNSDQKRDKASFLLEVIEYIQFLQEKVNRYEGSYTGWNSEPAKLAPWGNNHGPSGSFVDQLHAVNGVPSPVLMFGAKLDEKPTAIPLNLPRTSQTQAECSITKSIDFKTVGDQLSGMASTAGAVCSSQQPDIYAPVRTSCAAAQPPTRLPSDGGNVSIPQLHLWQSKSAECEPIAAAEISKDQELSLEGGTININSIYSQGLLNTLTRALQSSGVDLSQASISVQVDVGNRAKNRQNVPQPMEKSVKAHHDNQSLLRARVENYRNESDHTLKRLKTV